MIKKAMLFAQRKHKGQKYDLDKDFFEAHCDMVYRLLQFVTNDEDILCAALLHDTLEDTDTTLKELKKEFGEEIANLVHEVTNEDGENGKCFPRLKSKKAIILKFADRLVNLSNIHYWDEKKQNWYLKKSKFWRDK